MQSVINCKGAITYLAENKNLPAQLLRSKWNDFKEIITVLQIPYKATIALQKHDLTLSDSFGIWLKMKIHLQSPIMQRLCKSNFVNCLVDSLNSRQQIIFDNDAMLGAIYLDPRYRGEIVRDTDLMVKATQMLTNLWRRLSNFHPEVTNRSGINLSTESSGGNLSIDFENPKILDEYLSRTNHSRDMQTVANYHGFSIEHEIEIFQPDQLSSDASIISFWKSMKSKNPHLYEIATVIYAIPPAETQIERDFSLLEFIFSQRRQRLSSEMIEAILSINLNSELFFEVKREKIMKSFQDSLLNTC